MADLVKVTIDGREVLVPKGTLLVEAAKQAGVEIPVFCYHEKMHPVGACRMCLVEIEKMPKVQTACTTPVSDGMVVHTDSPMVEKARKGVMEFLLCNHPLDCPVCDKGGECPLQNTTFKYASDRSRFGEEKRHFVKPIRLSEKIVLDRERCIMCSRCVRYVREIAGDESLTLVSRGSRSYVGVMPGRSFDSPFSGNTIELCPVGALTSAKFRFRARVWELKETPTVCAQCSVGCNIKVGSRNGELLRLTSRENTPVDDGWLCDRGRFTYQFVNSPERLTTPMIRRDGKLVPASWADAVEAVSRRLRQMRESYGSESLGGMISARSTNEDLYLFQKLFRSLLGSQNLDHGLHGQYVQPEGGVDAASGSIEGLESAQIVLLVDVDPINQQPVLDLRLKKAWQEKRAKLVSIGARETDLTKRSSSWLVTEEGAEAAVVKGILHIMLTEGLLGDAARERLGDRYDVVAQSVSEFAPERVQEAAGVAPEAIRKVAGLLAGTTKVAVLFPRPLPGAPAGLQEACGWLASATGCLTEPGSGGLFPLGLECNSQGAIDMGVLPNLLPGQQKSGSAGLSGLQMVKAAAEGQLKALYMVGLDPVGQEDAEQVRAALSKLELLVVQDIFLTETAKIADVVLPGASFAEKDGSYTNLERRVQRLNGAIPCPGEALQDWEIIAAVGNGLGAGWDFRKAAEVFDAMVAETPLYSGLSFDVLGDKGQQWSYPGALSAQPEHNGRERHLWYRRLPAEEPESVEVREQEPSV
ncbi:MAG TPA: NADH-quinone oxidoreductase subunit NuoG [Chloroflexota bacterium]|nr:NADH-quinone oxidoreductase subunit NuoG [Chloroflexota bacterium]